MCGTGERAVLNVLQLLARPDLSTEGFEETAEPLHSQLSARPELRPPALAQLCAELGGDGELRGELLWRRQHVTLLLLQRFLECHQDLELAAATRELVNGSAAPRLAWLSSYFEHGLDRRVTQLLRQQAASVVLIAQAPTGRLAVGSAVRQVRTTDRLVTDLVHPEHRDDASTDSGLSQDTAIGSASPSRAMSTMADCEVRSRGAQSSGNSSRGTGLPERSYCGVAAVCGGALCIGGVGQRSSSGHVRDARARHSWGISPMACFFGGAGPLPELPTDAAPSGCTGGCLPATGSLAFGSQGLASRWVCAVLPVDSGSEGEAEDERGATPNAAGSGNRAPEGSQNGGAVVTAVSSSASTTAPNPAAVALGSLADPPSTLGTLESRSERSGHSDPRSEALPREPSSAGASKGSEPPTMSVTVSAHSSVGSLRCI